MTVIQNDFLIHRDVEVLGEQQGALCHVLGVGDSCKSHKTSL